MSACSHCGGAKFTSFWGALILCIRCNGTGMEKEAHMTHPDDKAWDDLVERLKAPHYWMSGSDEGHEGENDAPREAADAVTSLRTQLAEVTAQRDAARKEEREACAMVAAAYEALAERTGIDGFLAIEDIAALTPTDADGEALAEAIAELRRALTAGGEPWRESEFEDCIGISGRTPGAIATILNAVLSDDLIPRPAEPAQAAQVEMLREALDEIAKQKRTDELETEYDAECADFEGGYDACIDRARAALIAKPAQVDWEALLIAAKRMSSDYQTSVTHHPKHVLVRREDFDALIAAAQEGRE